MIQRFTDSEYAVVIDSLAQTRDRIHPAATPNIDSALAKFHSWAVPTGCEFVALSGEDAKPFEAAP